MKRLRRIRDLMTGRMDSALTEALLGQLEATKEGAWLAMAMIGGEVGRTGAHEQMRAIEHLGDEERRRLVEELRSALVTPIDREDLFRLSRSIDDVLDSLRDFVQESHLYQVPDQIRFSPMLDQVIVGIDALEDAVRNLASAPRPSRTTRWRPRRRAAPSGGCTSTRSRASSPGTSRPTR